MRPGRRALLALLGLCLVALAVPWLPWLTGVLGGGLLVLFGTMVAEASLLGRLQVTLTRRRRAVLSLDEEEELPFTLWSNSTRPLSVVVRQPWPPLLTTGSFEDALVQVVNLGGDADSAGAVAGALAGAAYGLEAIPARWRATLHGAWPPRSEVFWTADDFVALADRLVGQVA